MRACVLLVTIFVCHSYAQPNFVEASFLFDKEIGQTGNGAIKGVLVAGQFNKDVIGKIAASVAAEADYTWDSKPYLAQTGTANHQTVLAGVAYRGAFLRVGVRRGNVTYPGAYSKGGTGIVYGGGYGMIYRDWLLQGEVRHYLRTHLIGSDHTGTHSDGWSSGGEFRFRAGYRFRPHWLAMFGFHYGSWRYQRDPAFYNINRRYHFQNLAFTVGIAVAK